MGQRAPGPEVCAFFLRRGKELSRNTSACSWGSSRDPHRALHSSEAVACLGKRWQLQTLAFQKRGMLSHRCRP